MPTISDVIIANMALSAVGADSQITALDDDSAEANACNLWFEYSRLQTLEAFDWSFARRRKRLVLHPHPIPEEGEWALRYIYPSDCLAFRRFINPGGSEANPIPYELENATVDVVAGSAFDENDEQYWTANSGWSIGAGVATGATASTDLEQTILTELVEGTSYSLTFTMTRTSGSVLPKVGGTSGTSRSASDTYTETIVAGATDLLEFTGSSFVGTIDNVSLTPVTGGRAILSDLADGIGVYTIDNTTYSMWTPQAIQALSYKLANNIAFSITGKASVKDRMEQYFFRALSLSAAAAANEEVSKPARDVDWIRER